MSPAHRRRIVVIGPNPAYQKTLQFDEVALSEVNRASSVRCYAGGKGTNFCRALRCYDAHKHGSGTVLLSFLGGSTGEMVMKRLHEDQIEVVAIAVPGETRTCITCLSSNGNMMELIEPSLAVPAEAAAAMDEAVARLLHDADGVAIMGSLPDGSDPDLYTRWTKIAVASGKPLLIDAVKGVGPSLKVADARTVLKVNMAEFLKITGCATVGEAFTVAMRDWSVGVIGVTNGPGEAFLMERGGPLMKMLLPHVDGIVNPLGSGDTADAIMLSELLHGSTALTAFRRALAAASANCLQLDSGKFLMEDLERISRSIQEERAKL